MEIESKEAVMDPEVCCNCSRSFNARRGRAATKRFIYKGITNGVKTEASVAMWKALIEIYNIKSLGIWSRGGCTLELDTELALCQICGLAVAKLYGAMRSFIELQQKSSYVHEVISNFSDEFAKLVNDTEEFGADPSQPVIKSDLTDWRTETSETGQGTPLLLAPRKSTRRVTPKKFLYEGTVVGQKEEVFQADDDRDGDYYPPGAYDTSQSEQPLDYYASTARRPSLNDDFQDPHSQISKELFSIEFDPDAPSSPKEYPLKEHLCQICATGFDKASNLKRHLLLTHEVGERTKDFICNICGKSYYFNYLLKNHQICHSEDRPAQCDICKATFKSKDSLLHHTRDVHRNHEDPKLKCKHCQKKFRQIRCLNEHILMIHRVGKGKKLVACSKGCGATFKRKKSMLGHVRHNQCRELPVPSKNKSKRTKDDDSDEDAGSGRKFYCPFKCNAVYKSRPSLALHVRTRCTRNPENATKLRPTRVSTRTRTRPKKLVEKSEEEAPAEEIEQEQEAPSFTVALEEPEPYVNVKTETEAVETIVEEEHEMEITEEIEEDIETQPLEQEQEYEEVDNQQCYEITEIYEVQELPEGVHVQELHGEELIQTIHYEEFQLPEESQ